MLRFSLPGVAALLAAAALFGSAYGQSCNCNQATLDGDTVTAKYSSTYPAVNVVVSAASGNVELSNVGWNLSNTPAIPSPLFNIDFGAATIRIDFVGGLGAGAGAGFTFGSLDPKPLAGCPGTRIITGATVTTNNASLITAGAAVVTGNQIFVRAGNPSGQVNWSNGGWILVTLQYACPTPPPSGHINFHKSIGTLPLPPTGAAGTYVHIGITCSNGFSTTSPGPGIHVSLPGTTGPFPYGTSCTFTELNLPPNFTNAQGATCTWQPAPPSQTVTVNSPITTVTFTNSYTCTPTTLPMGHFSVYKSIGTLALPPNGVPGTSVSVTANCTNGYTQTVAINTTTAWSMNNMPLGTNCTFTEATPAPFTNANGQQCTWQQQPSQTVTLNSSQQNVTFTNSYTCTPTTPPTPVTCCSPLTKTNFQAMLSEKLTGGIMDPYEIHFQSTPWFNGAMQTYYNYISYVDPTITTANVFLYLVDCNDNAPTTASACLLGGTLLAHKTVTWPNNAGNQPRLGTYTVTAGTTSIPAGWTGYNAVGQVPTASHWANIFSTQLSVSHRYMVIAIPVVWRASVTQNHGFEYLFRCGWFIHQTNHMQSTMKVGKPTTATTVLSAEEFNNTPLGRIILRGQGRAEPARGDRAQ